MKVYIVKKENRERYEDYRDYIDKVFINEEQAINYVNKEKEKEKKYEEELAEDIMKILTCYSARYYGARGGRKKKNVDFD